MKRYLFVTIGIALLVAGLYVRHQNGQAARSQAADIVKADAAGADTTTAQADLQSFARLHTGASVTYMLQGSYDRAVAAAKTANAAASAANSQIYLDAQRACAGRTSSVIQAQCNQEYLARRLQAVPATQVPAPKQPDYQRSAPSPLWAPDLAGSLSLGGLLALIFGIIVLKPWRMMRRVR
jgi:hypothetical protein